MSIITTAAIPKEKPIEAANLFVTSRYTVLSRTSGAWQSRYTNIDILPYPLKKIADLSVVSF